MIDPNNTNCYPGFGNTVYNLVNPSIGGTFVGYTSNPIDNTENRSIYFDGSNDYILYGDTTSFSVTLTTICVWFKKSHGSSFMTLVDKGRDNYGAWSVCVDETANKVTFKARISGTNRSITCSSNYNSNSWNYVCGVFDGINLSIYLNGTLNNSASYSGTIDNNSVAIRIGGANDGYYLSGNIGHVSIYNKALTSTEILQNYNATKKKYDPDENIVTNGLVLNIDPSKNASYPGTGNTIYDLSGSGSNGTLINSPTFSSLNGGFLNLPGSYDYIDLGQNFNFTTQNFSLSYWVNVNSFQTNQGTQGPIAYYKGDYNIKGYYSQIGHDGSYTVVTNSSGANYVSSTSAGIVTSSNWYHVTDVKNGTSVRTYVNGIDRTSTAASHQTISSSSDSFKIGYYKPDYLIDSNLKISQFLIYNRALTQQEISQNYNATKNRFVNALSPVRNGLVLELDAGQRASYPGTGNTWYDLSGNNLNGTLTNGPTFSGIGATSSISFDGSNDYIDCGYNSTINSSTQFTIECWYKSASINVEGMLFSTYTNSPSNLGYHFEIYQSKIMLQVWPSGTYTQSSTTLSNNTWYQLIVTYNSGTITYYVNGISAGSASYTFNPSTANLLLGKWPTNSYYLNGQLANVRYYNRALSAYEIKQNFDYYRTRYNI